MMEMPTSPSSKVLVTGGAGYIGSHTVLELIKAGFEPVIFDNFCNSSPAVLPRLEALAGRPISLIQGDCRSVEDLAAAFEAHDFEAVLHFAGLKAVGESVAEPLRYYDYNVVGFMRVLDAAKAAKVRSVVLSSSATVYAAQPDNLIDEMASLGPINPYGQSKLICEIMGRDLCHAEPDMAIAFMRYFNPVGAHPSGTIGEAPNQIPNNLLPYVSMVADGQLERLTIHGDDYDTPDGTGVRDYIHVVDLAKGHIQAIDFLSRSKGAHTFNLGTGRGTSVKEVVDIYGSANACEIPYVVGPRRPGDQGCVVADPAKANDLLGFRCQYSLQEACTHSHAWQTHSPNGYDTVSDT